ncbi:NAD(P)-dependent oxidoreductase [Niabella digestorum]|uniref:NAD(P)H-binding protein n=1 Tax=Niabella digestorum TaxID=3117701 RepID=A0ABU7RJG7_9BACT
MKKLIIFGANGGTGCFLVNLALRHNYQVVAMVRRPGTITLTHPHLKVVKSDILQPDTYFDELAGAYAVISAIGIKAVQQPVYVFSEGIKMLTTAMHRQQVRRLICISASGVEVSPKHNLFIRFFIKNVLQRFLRHLYDDTLRMEDVLKKSNLDWTSVRPPRLTKGSYTGQYRYAVNDFLDACLSISRADLADFIINHIDDAQTYQAIVEVAH